MGEGQPGQGGAPAESVAAFMARRRRELANVTTGARAAAHQAYGDAIRNGQDISLGQPSDLLKFGAGILSGSFGGNPLLPGQFGGGIELPPGTEVGRGSEPEAGDDQNPEPPSTTAGPPPKARSSAHPGFAESLIPVWGSAKEAYADAQDGDI